MAADYLASIKIDPASFRTATMDIQHERDVAIADLIEDNTFTPLGVETQGPYALNLGVVNNRLAFDIHRHDGGHLITHLLSIQPFRKTIKDYFFICDSYYEAIRTASPSKIEAIDMGRRGLHNEASQLLMTRLASKIEIDFETSRRLFTLVCALYWQG